jgi:uncharacterized short protein YbdD (DUF466 family)
MTAARLRHGFGRLAWYLREVSGESAYDRYCEHQERHHPGGALMTRAEFWRWRMDERDRNPGARCC